MAALKKTIYLYKKKAGKQFEWEASPSRTIVDAFSLSVLTGLANRKDTFSFRIVNFASSRNWFEMGDNIKIHLYKNSETPSSSNLVIDGIITSPIISIEPNGRIYEISGKSRTEFLLEALVQPLTLHDQTPPQIAAQVIDALNNTFDVSNVTKVFKYDTTSVPSTKSDGSAHSTYDISEHYVSALMLLERYASVQYTKDVRGSYIFYIDNQNKFYFTYKNNTVSSTAMVEGTANIKEIKTSINSDVVNYLIMSGGFDPDGKGINVPVFDAASIQRHGPKWKLIPTNYAHDLITSEQRSQPSKFTLTSGQFPSSYSYTTTWKSSVTDTKNAPLATAGSVIIIANDDEWRTAVRREVEEKLKIDGNAALRLLANPRHQVNLVITRESGFTLANLMRVTLLSAKSGADVTKGFDNKELRLVGINHDDWTTTLELIEDENTVIT